MGTTDTVTTEGRTRVSSNLTRVFEAVLQFRSEAPADAVFQADDRDGAYIGSGDATVAGERVRGMMAWSLYAGDCLYPRIAAVKPFPTNCTSAR